MATLVAAAWQQTPDDPKLAEDLKRDREMGAKYAAEIDKELKPSTDKEQIARLERIGKEISAIANATHAQASWGDKRFSRFEYTFKLVRDKDVNAFSLPGGYIYFYDGLMKFAESDDEVAGVVAHEIAHASFRHVATLQREQSRLQAIQLPLILLALLTGGGGAAMGTLGGTSLLGTALGSGWSVKAEQAADFGGFQYLQQSKYDATGLLTFMERLAVDEKRKLMGVDLGIYRTHPPSPERASAIKGFMRGAGLPIRRSKVSASCRVDIKPHEDGSVRIEFRERPIVSFAGVDALARADKAAQRLDAFFDSEPELFEVRATSDGKVYGARTLLLDLSHDDAVASDGTVSTLAVEVGKNLKRAVATLSFRVWLAG